MKKIIMIAVMAIVALTASAQKGEYYVTPHVGAGWGGFSDYQDELKNGVAAQIGADFEYMLGDKFGVSAGVDFLYHETGSWSFPDVLQTSTGTVDQIELKQKFGFLNIPILAQYHLGGFAIKAGIQPGFLVSANQSAKQTHPEINSHKYIDGSVKDNYESFALGIPVGVSYTFNTPVTLDLRYTLPLTKISKMDGVNSKFSTVMFTVGYRF